MMKADIGRYRIFKNNGRHVPRVTNRMKTNKEVESNKEIVCLLRGAPSIGKSAKIGWDRSMGKKGDSTRSNCQVTRVSRLGRIARSYRISKAFPCRFIEQNWLQNTKYDSSARPIIVSHLWMQFDTVCLLPSRRFCPTFCNLISLASRTNKNSVTR